MDDLFDAPAGEPAPDTLDALARAEAACRRCPLHGPATQVVPGEGPADARVMLVGEQPGDQEDLAGRPFVGPAGRVLDAALERVGIARDSLFVTNAVKHFKFARRGQRRIHEKPDAGEVRHCRWWLDAERRIVRPKLIVALGATAVLGVTGKAAPIGESRGVVRLLEDGAHALITVHPSYLLRIREEERKRAEWRAFLEDLAVARDWAAAA